MERIKYIERKDLEVKRYDICVEKADNSRIYALSWYLDAVSNHWGCLVFDDYKAVMPLPWKRKYGIKYVTIPSWVQQLGVFCQDKNDCPTVAQFVAKIPKKFRKITYQFNEDNVVELPRMTYRNNYVLPLKSDYKAIFQGFSKMRRRVVKGVDKTSYDIKTNHSIAVIINEYKRYIQAKSNHDESDLLLFERLYKKALERDMAFNIQVWQADEFLSGIVFFKDNNRIYSLFLAQSEVGKRANTNSLIYDNLIKQYQQTDYILDFEGSDITGVQRFVQSFGAVNKPYVLWQKPIF